MKSDTEEITSELVSRVVKAVVHELTKKLRLAEKQPYTRVTPGQGAAILLRIDQCDIPKNLIKSLTDKIQTACGSYKKTAKKEQPKGLPCTWYETGKDKDKIRYSIRLDDLFAWYDSETNFDIRRLRDAS